MVGHTRQVSERSLAGMLRQTGAEVAGRSDARQVRNYNRPYLRNSPRRDVSTGRSVSMAMHVRSSGPGCRREATLCKVCMLVACLGRLMHALYE